MAVGISSSPKHLKAGHVDLDTDELLPGIHDANFGCSILCSTGPTASQLHINQLDWILIYRFAINGTPRPLIWKDRVRSTGSKET
jgi:hypothetical protein